jgi:cellulose synthase/poly-beta-1,6-N-acetylglucosamine synthase-like glycosyltransferase
VDVNCTFLSYVMAAMVLYYAVLFCMSLGRRRGGPEGAGARPLFVVIVPARNEELVVAGTLASLAGLDYAGELRVLVVDDASSDATGSVCEAFAEHDVRTRVLRRGAGEGGNGKSDVLNHAFRTVLDWQRCGDPWLAGAAEADVVIGVVDADGQLDRECLQRVAPYFDDPGVGAVQVAVRIANVRRSLLAHMQDVEFVAFSWLVQVARDRLGSLGLGGNGQFARLSALVPLGEAPWTRSALCEDLDLGLKLVEHGWSARFCPSSYVEQQGLEHWKPLLKQRTRWIQGHYQCWRHIPRLVANRKVPVATRADLTAYLVLVAGVVVTSVNLAFGIAGASGAMKVSDTFLAGVAPPGAPCRLALLAMSVFPLAVFMGSYQRCSPARFAWYQVPAASVLFTLYAYVWSYATLRAWARMAMGRWSWVKTPRVAGAAPVGAGNVNVGAAGS